MTSKGEITVAEPLKTVRDVDVRGRRVFLRADLNVPLTSEGGVRDASRIEATLPTLADLLRRGAAVTVASHLGRPKGRVRPELSLGPVAAELGRRLGREVPLLPGVVGPAVDRAKAAIPAGGCALLENLRFDPGEEADDPAFAAELARGQDLLVNDAFGAVHRAHASVHALARLLPSVAGLLLAREVAALARVLDAPDRPLVVVLGGAKVSDKLAVLGALARRADRLLVGGGMANTLIAAAGGSVGRSHVESDRFAAARALTQELGPRLGLPTDVRAAATPDAPPGGVSVVAADRVPEALAAFDIGPTTAEAFAEAIASAGTVFWNGPLGVYENPAFAQGTARVARAVADASGYTVVGGGDSLAALADLGLVDRVDHASTGGGASLEFLEGRPLPGIAVLMEQGAA
jgi:phosphoglycerate kinase